MQAQQANKQTCFAGADHPEHGNGLTVVALHQLQRCCGQSTGVDCDRIWSGDVGCSDLCPLVGTMVLQGAAQVAVGDQAGQARGGIGRLNPARPKAAPAGTALGEMAYHCGHGYGRACGGGQVEGADLAVDRAIKHHIAAAGEAGVHAAHQGHAGGAVGLEVGKDRQQLVGFAAVGEQQGSVFRIDNAQVAVEGIHRVEQHGREADGGKGGVLVDLCLSGAPSIEK